MLAAAAFFFVRCRGCPHPRLARPALGRGGHPSWLNRNRALLIRWSKKAENHLALLQLASGLIAFKKAHTARLAAGLQG